MGVGEREYAYSLNIYVGMYTCMCFIPLRVVLPSFFLSLSLSLSLWEFAPSSRPLLGVTVMVSEEVGWPAAAARVARLARCDMRTQRSLHMREIVRACVYTHTHTHKYIFIGRIDKPAQLSAREREKKGGAEPRHKCFSFSLTHTHKLLGS